MKQFDENGKELTNAELDAHFASKLAWEKIDGTIQEINEQGFWMEKYWMQAFGAAARNNDQMAMDQGVQAAEKTLEEMKATHAQIIEAIDALCIAENNSEKAEKNKEFYRREVNYKMKKYSEVIERARGNAERWFK